MTVKVRAWPPSTLPRLTDPLTAIDREVFTEIAKLGPALVAACRQGHGAAAMALCHPKVAAYGGDGLFAIAQLITDAIAAGTGLDLVTMDRAEAADMIGPRNGGVLPADVALPDVPQLFASDGFAERLEVAARFIGCCVTARADLAYANFGQTDAERAQLLQGLCEVLAGVLAAPGPAALLADPMVTVGRDVFDMAAGLREPLTDACRRLDAPAAVAAFAPPVGSRGVDAAFAIAVVLADAVCRMCGIDTVAGTAGYHRVAAVVKTLPPCPQMMFGDGFGARQALAQDFLTNHLHGGHQDLYFGLRSGRVVPGDLLQGLCEVLAGVLAEHDAAGTPPGIFDGLSMVHVARFDNKGRLAVAVAALADTFLGGQGCCIQIDGSGSGPYWVRLTRKIQPDGGPCAGAVRSIIEEHGGIYGTDPAKEGHS